MKKQLTICSIWILFAAKVDLFSIPVVSDIQDMIGLVTEISAIATSRHDLTSGNLFKKKTDPTLLAVNKLSDQISELTQTINVKMDKMMTAVLENVPRAIQFANLMRKLIDLISRVDELYEDYLFYTKKSGNVTRYTIEEFGRVVTSHRYGDLPDLLRQTYHLFIPGQIDEKDQSIVDVMLSSLQSMEESEQCNQLKTGQQRLYDLYGTVILTEIKGFTMTTYAFGMLAIFHNESFETEIDRALFQTISRSSEYLSSVYDALETLGREIFLCDPAEHIKGETFLEFNSLTRVVLHETMMYNTCGYTCGSISQSNILHSYHYDSETRDVRWYPSQPCRGIMFNCDDIGDSEFCELPKESDKRFSWIKTSSSGTFGTKDKCANGTTKEIREYREWNTCSSCFCLCSEDKPSSKAIRTISLRPQLADIEENMIVTGVRFEQKNMMIHVQIEEGKLGRAGQVDKSTVHWKDLEEFDYLEEGEEGKFVKVIGENEENLEHGTDYQFIRNGQRDVNLDTVNSMETGYVVTGLKMSRDPDNKKAIQLDIHITPFDFSKGLLVPTDDKPSKWLTHKDMPGHESRSYSQRIEQDVTDYHRGDDYYDNIPDSEDFADMWFVPSNKYSDASQSTVPFLDRRTAAPSPRVPLDGISLFHRGREKSGGFLGFRLRIINLHEYVNPQMKPENVLLYQKSRQEISDTSMPEAE